MAKAQSETIKRIVNYLQSENVLQRVAEQRKARELLFSGQPDALKEPAVFDDLLRSLRKELSSASEVFTPDATQKRIYSADTGTSIIPGIFRNLFINNRLSFVVRPGSLEDLSRFVRWANERNQRFTVRGTGTWPFGGAVPLNGEVVLDLSYLNFMRLFPEDDLLAIGPGATFRQAREYLKKQRYSLRQEITNPGSGTIAGWIATGG
ncbi:MAG TPA: FAD-binding oxidoreductase, partial [Caldithrix abyssi]|nr:FAD-binding oxidoreductase [Caldithrix abyssi]